MRRWLVLTGVVALCAAACERDSAPSTSAPATTAVPATTNSAATTTADPAGARLALAQVFAGEWEGEWTNTTHSSTGPISLALAVDPEARTATLSVDLGGAVFGAGDPDPFGFMADLTAASPFAAATPLLGELTIGVDSLGRFTIEAPDVPAAGVAWLRAAGTATSERIQLQYTVGFEDGGEAWGVAALRRPAQ